MANFAVNHSLSYAVGRSSLHEAGVFALEEVNPESRSVLFEDAPDLFIQSLENRGDNLICGNCHSYVGTLSMQVDMLLGRLSRQNLDGILGRSKQLCHQDNFEDAMLRPIFCCQNKCGELYCSESCAANHWKKSHCLLCTGSMEEDASLVKFKIHAVETNEIFLMAADHFAYICTQAEARLDHVTDIDEKRKYMESAARDVAEPYSSFVRNLWWDAAIAPDGTDPQHLMVSLVTIVDEAWALLSDAFQLEARGLSGFLSAEYLSRTIGMFEQNNVGVRLSSPPAVRVEALHAGDKSTAYYATVARQVADSLSYDDFGMEDEHEYEEEEEVDKGDEMEEEEAGDEAADADYRDLQRTLETHGILSLFPPLDGAAFYLTICRINHSCVPNVRVEYVNKGVDGGLMAEVKVVRPIGAGEELVQSYIDENLSWEDRRTALMDYGFECTCEKCVRRM